MVFIKNVVLKFERSSFMSVLLIFDKQIFIVQIWTISVYLSVDTRLPTPGGSWRSMKWSTNTSAVCPRPSSTPPCSKTCLSEWLSASHSPDLPTSSQPINSYQPDPPENYHFNVKKVPKTWHIFNKIAKNVFFFFVQFLAIFFNWQVFGNLLTLKWQFSRGSDQDLVSEQRSTYIWVEMGDLSRGHCFLNWHVNDKEFTRLD